LGFNGIFSTNRLYRTLKRLKFVGDVYFGQVVKYKFLERVGFNRKA